MTDGGGWDIKARRARWDSDEHPRDRKGRWIETGATVRVWGGGRGQVVRNIGGGRLEVRFEDGATRSVHRNYLTVEQTPRGGAPTGTAASRPQAQKVEAPSRGAEDYTPDAPDTRTRAADLQPGEPVLVYGETEAGDDTARVGVVQSVKPREDGQGHRVQLSSGPVDVPEDATARRIPADRLAALNEAIERGDSTADQMARELLDEITAEDDREAEGGDAPSLDRAEREQAAGGSDAAANAGDVAKGDRVAFDVTVTEAHREWFDTPGARRVPEPGQTVRVRGTIASDPEQDMLGGRTIRLADGARWESQQGGIGLLSTRGREWQVDDGQEVQRLGRGDDQPKRPARTERPVGDRAEQGGLFADVGKEAAGTEDMFTAAERDREEEERAAAQTQARDRTAEPDEPDRTAEPEPEPGGDELAPRAGVFDPEQEQRIADAIATFRQGMAGDSEMGMIRPFADLRDLLMEQRGEFDSQQRAEVERLTDVATGLRDEWDRAHAEQIRQERRRRDRVTQVRVDAVNRAKAGDLDGALVLVDDAERELGDDDGWESIRDQARAEWIDPTPLPSTDDGTPPSPEGMTAVRRARLVAAIEEAAAGYRWTGDPGRYIAEGAGSNGVPRPGEKEWVDAYIAAHPEVLQFSDRERLRRGRQREAQEEQFQQQAKNRSSEAFAAFQAGEHDRALALIDEAEELSPISDRWDRIRDVINEGRPAAAASDDSGEEAAAPPAVPDAPAAPEAAEAPPPEPVEQEREPAPEGQVYGDQIQSGDTLAVPSSAGGAYVGRRFSARGTYVQPGGPARTGGDTVTRTVTEVTPTSGGQAVKVRLDDGRAISVRADELVSRGEPAEVTTPGGERIGERVTHKQVAAGDHISYAVPAQNLPASFDRDQYGLSRFDEVRVTGTVASRQPGMPYGELEQVTLRLPDGTLVPVARMRGRWPERVMLLNPGQEDQGGPDVPGLEDSPDPSTPAAEDLVPGDRLPAVPGGPSGVVEQTDRIGDGLTHVTVRTDDDARHVRPIPDERPVQIADEPAQPTVDTTEVVGLAVGDWFVDEDGQVLRVVSEPVVDGDRARFDVATAEGPAFEVEADRGSVVARVTGQAGTSAADADERSVDLDEDQAATPAPPTETEPPARVPVMPVDEGMATGRVRLRTAQRRRILDLELDAEGAPVDEDVRQAAARLRARQPLTAAQMRALSGHLRTLGEDESLPGARRRSHQRTAAWVDAAYARVSGFPVPPDDPGRDAPEKTYARNVTMGDVIALPDDTDPDRVVYGTVTARKAISGFGMVQVHVRMSDGSVQQRLIPDGVDLWLLPDLPADRELLPAFDDDPDFRPEEHINPSRLEVGDAIRWPLDGGRYPIANVRSIRKTSRMFAEEDTWEAELAVLNDRDEPIYTETVTLSSRGRPAVVRTWRGPASQEQPWDSALSYDGAGAVTADEVRPGDRVTIPTASGPRGGFVQAVAPVTGDDGQQIGRMVALRGYDGETTMVPLDDAAEIVQHSRGSVDAEQRIADELERHWQDTRQRAVARALADAETGLYRQVAARLLGDLDTRPVVPARDRDEDEVFSQALTRLEEVWQAQPDNLADDVVAALQPDDDEQAAELRRRLTPLVAEVRDRAAANMTAAIGQIDPLPGETWDQALRRVMLQYRDAPPASLGRAGESLAAVELSVGDAPLPDVPAPDADELSARMAAYRAALPEDLANIGRKPVRKTVFRPGSLADLEAGRVPDTDTITTWVDDVAEDGGPGEHAMRHLAVLRAVGADLDALYRQRLADADVDGLKTRFDELKAMGQELWNDAYAADQRLVDAAYANRPAIARQFGFEHYSDLRRATPEIQQQARDAGWASVADEVRTRDEAVDRYKAYAAERQGTQRQLGEIRRKAALEVLAQVRDMGGDPLEYLNATGRPLTDRSRLSGAMRIAEASYPSEWLAMARDAGPVRVRDGNGRGQYTIGGDVPEIRLPWESQEMSIPRDGDRVTETAPSSNIGGNDAARAAVHEFAHHLSATVPGLAASERVFQWDRTSTGEIGERTRGPLYYRSNGTSRARVRDGGGFASPYAGREYDDGTFEVFSVGMESLLGGSPHLDDDDDYRAWTLGTLALLGTSKDGPRRSPLSGVNLSELSVDELRTLLSRVWGNPDEVARVMAELGRRDRDDDDPLAGVDLDTLELGDLVQLLGEVDDDYAIARISAAMERWEAQQAINDAEERASAERAARVDELRAGGMPEMEAWAEVHQLSYQELERQQNDAQFDRLPGETRDQMARRHYDLWLHQQFLKAEAATNGFMLGEAGRARGIDPKALFSGRRSEAEKYASQELKVWWDANGWMNFTEFKAQMLQRERDRKAAEAGRTARDFNR
ncbi:hypothetical protein [Nonomuraea sp. NPDC005650]|uniref:hypothetical protein n=1 Tax=Nonomuraea sp. NPDC005650 TaxID=3157045 RepID=UPI0033A72CB5